MKTQSLLFLFLSLLAFISYASNARTYGEPLVVDNARVHKVQSTIVPDQTYEICVGLPDSYQNSPERDYPIIVVLDGQWSFTLASDIASNLAYDGMIPEVITVGITWGGEGDDPGLLRFRDFLRPEFPFFPSGGAELFLSALTDELIPYVGSLYRVGDKRVLLGGSLGGLFTSYAMLEKPGFFNGYIATAGSYSMDQSYFTEKLASMYGTTDLTGVRSFLSVGSLDDNKPYVESLNTAISRAYLRGFENTYSVFRGIGHAGAEPISITRGLQYVFKRPFLKLSEEFLQQYTGLYEGVQDGDYPPIQITVSVLGRGRLLVEGGDSREYLAETESKFYVEGINASIEFPQSGQLIINSQGNLLYFNRVEQ